jgi:hypothetical protein
MCDKTKTCHLCSKCYSCQVIMCSKCVSCSAHPRPASLGSFLRDSTNVHYFCPMCELTNRANLKQLKSTPHSDLDFWISCSLRSSTADQWVKKLTNITWNWKLVVMIRRGRFTVLIVYTERMNIGQVKIAQHVRNRIMSVVKNVPFHRLCSTARNIDSVVS